MLKRPLLIDEQLFFIHIPKCAGTSFISLLDEMFVNAEICPTHYDLRKIARGEISNEELQGYKFIRGHFPYDLIVPRLKKQPRLITFLRDPVTQFISYFQMRKRVPDPISEIQEKIKDLTLDEFLEQSPYVDVIANNTAKLFAGMPNGDRLFDFSTTIDVPRAKKRLDECEFIGITEEYEKSIELFCHLFDLPIPEQQRKLNISPDREERREIDPETLKRIAKIQFADIELYEYGKHLYEQAINKMVSEKKAEASNGHVDSVHVLTDKVEFDFQRVFPGTGWQVGEEHPTHKVIRWSGPDSTSRLYLPIKKDKDAHLKLHIVAWMSQEILNSLKLFVNDENVSLVREPDTEAGGFVFKGMIPKGVLQKQPGLSEFVFQIKETLRPIDLDPNNADVRQIGLCYNRFSVKAIPE